MMKFLILIILSLITLNFNCLFAQENNFETVKNFALKGDSIAQFNLGLLYYRGQDDVETNKVEALNWFEKSAIKGYPEAQFVTFIMYLNGEGAPKDMDKAFEWCKKSASNGHPKGQHNLANFYNKGIVVEKSEEKAFYWCKKSAEQGYERAQNELGIRYFNGEGVARDLGLSFYWLKKSAEQNNPQSQYYCGKFYFEGTGVPKSESKAIYWLTQSAEQEFVQSQYLLCYIYDRKTPSEKNIELRNHWLRRAAKNGHPRAKELLDNLIKEEKFKKVSHLLFNNEAKISNEDIQFLLNYCDNDLVEKVKDKSDLNQIKILVMDQNRRNFQKAGKDGKLYFKNN